MRRSPKTRLKQTIRPNNAAAPVTREISLPLTTTLTSILWEVCAVVTYAMNSIFKSLLYSQLYSEMIGTPELSKADK